MLEEKGRTKAGAMGSTRPSTMRDMHVVVAASGGDVCRSLLLFGAAGTWHGIVMAVACACKGVVERGGMAMNQGYGKAHHHDEKKKGSAARESQDTLSIPWATWFEC